MLFDSYFLPKAYDLDYESELFESEQGQSYDIASDLDLICHRRRSNTAQRLDRLKKEKINQSRTKTIVWRCNSPTNDTLNEDRLSQDSPTSIGEETEITSKKQQDTFQSVRKSKSPPRKSGLTRLLEKFPSLPKNPFDEFAQFEGGMSESVPAKNIMIFIAINQPQQPSQINLALQQKLSITNELKIDNNNELINHQADSGVSSAANGKDSSNIQANGSVNITPTRKQSKARSNEPLEVVIVSTAKVQDLIGLICWQYTNEGREPKLNHDITRYCLRIAEDNGEVDPDFTSLNPKEPLSKFNFPSLALTEKTEEKVRTHIDSYTNGKPYSPRVPSVAHNVITSGYKISNAGSRLAALTRIIFKDAKLDVNQ